jgi:uncharacterized DUF497 family protein
MDETVRFEWDEAKAAANLRKHGVPFDEALAVFSDAGQVTVLLGADRFGGHREMTIALAGERLLAVVHTRRGDVVRLISARPAGKKERALWHL